MLKKKTENPPIPSHLLYRIGIVRVPGPNKGSYYAAKLYKASYRRDGIVTYKPIKFVSEAYLDYQKARVEGVQNNPGVSFDKDVKQGSAIYLQKGKESDPSDFEN